MRTVAKMYNIYNVLFLESKLQDALLLEDGKETVREVYVTIDIEDYNGLCKYDGFASIENLTCSIFRNLEQAQEDMNDY